MLVFADESGDPGRKVKEGSSLYFLVALVTFEDNNEALDCDRRIDLLRKQLNLAPAFEFHFSSNSARVREQFLQAVAPYPFFCHTFALNKDRDRLYGQGFVFKESLYKFAARMTFENAKPYLVNAKVVIDGSGGRQFRDELSAYLRKRIISQEGRRLIRSVRIQRSAGNNLLQLADYVAGVTNRALCGKQDGNLLKQKYLAMHMRSDRVWPK